MAWEEFERLERSILEAPGECVPSLRLAAETAAAARSPAGGDHALPPLLAAYVEKVALRAHEVRDLDIDLLRKASFSEDAILELTLSAALGAARSRLEHGLRVLKEMDAPQER